MHPFLFDTEAFVLPNSQKRHARRGEIISFPRDKSNQILIVVRGKIRVYLTQNGREITLSYIEPGGVFTTHTRAYLEAVEPSELHVLPANDFFQSARHNPELMLSAFSVLGQTLHGCFDIIEDFSFRDIEARIARLLLVELERRLDRVQLDEVTTVTIDLTGEEIGNLIGASRQSVSAALSRLCQKGIIARLSRTEFQILDRKALDLAISI